MSYKLTPIDMTGWWKCCENGCYNNPELTTTKCSSCNHTKCPSCGTPTRPPTPVQAGQYSIDEVDPSSNLQGGLQYAYPPQPLYASPIQPLAYTKPPSVKGWWKCCQCNQDVNPGLCGDTCLGCSHGKCDYCTTY